VLWKRYANECNAPLTSLEETGIQFALVGGNAVAAWVARVDEAAVRNTRDVDVLLRRADLDGARQALEGVIWSGG